MEPYRTFDPRAGDRLPATKQVVERVLSLPTGNAIGFDEVDTVCEIVRFAIVHASELRRRLPTVDVVLPTYARPRAGRRTPRTSEHVVIADSKVAGPASSGSTALGRTEAGKDVAAPSAPVLTPH